MAVFNEDTRVKIPATIQFLRLEYNYQSLKADDIDIDFNTKIFVNRFKPALETINGRKLYTIPRMIAPGVLMMEMPGRWKNARMLLMTPFFSSSVCHASVRSRKFIHLGRMKISTIKLV